VSELDLDAIEARAKAATPGPWDYEHDTELEKGCRCGSCLEPIDGRMIVESRKHDMVAVADARFIAHAREDVPALIAELRRLREENARLRLGTTTRSRDRLSRTGITRNRSPIGARCRSRRR